jgi:acetate kinase
VTTLLVLNAGSSSLKGSGYLPTTVPPRAVFHGLVEELHDAPRLSIADPSGRVLAEQRWPAGTRLSHAEALAALRRWLDRQVVDANIIAVAHRVVHGGSEHAAPLRIDAAALRDLESLVPLAPLHQPNALALIHAVAARSPGLPQVACFDTAFHRTLPDVAQRLALPRAWHDAGVRRYGFHGLSYEFIARRLRELDPSLAAGRVVVAHLGAGCSLCGMHDGRSVNTTMGFTPLDGLPMATRVGALDPGALLYLMDAHGMDAARLSRLLYHESGMLGVSGISGDMRTLLASADPHAREAVDLFVHRLVREIGALAADLGGLDALAFTAGIGEHAAAIRARVADGCGWLGAQADAAANVAHATVFSTAASRIRLMVVPTDEALMIALQAQALLWPGGAGAGDRKVEDPDQAER